jgi:hypothetical protein
MSLFSLNNFAYAVWQNAIDLDLFTPNRDRGPEFIEAKTRFADQEGIETFYERPARLFRISCMDIDDTYPFLFSYNNVGPVDSNSGFFTVSTDFESARSAAAVL